MLLIYHFFSVAIYSIYILFTTPVRRRSAVAHSPISEASTATPADSMSETSSISELDDEIEAKTMDDVLLPPSFIQYPALTVKSARVFWTALVVLAPVLWNEGQM